MYAEAERDAETLPVMTANTATPLILVVEDNDVTRDLLSMLLKRRGYRVETASTGAAGLKKLQDNDYAACLIDYHLPNMDGISVVKHIRASARPGRQLPRFIGMTTDIEGLLSDPRNCETLDLVFSKPIVATEVYTAIETSDPHVRSIAEAVKRLEEVAHDPDAPKRVDHDEHGVMYDRRRAERKITSISGASLVTDAGSVGECYVQNMSIFGASITTDVPLKHNETLTVGRSHARVVRVGRNKEFGLEFTGN
ncbi:response regulator [Tepidamorphus sp. 3E244]|uniref:response regulator n=1 Tax=Tepidamorphus sp. 3E244 TaxID=3385498 RepID=UPI0038FD35E9